MTVWNFAALTLMCAALLLACTVVAGSLYTALGPPSRLTAHAICKDPQTNEVFDAYQHGCDWVVKDADGYGISDDQKSRLRCKVAKDSERRPMSCVGI